MPGVCDSLLTMALHGFKASEQHARGEHESQIRRCRPVDGFCQMLDALVALLEGEPGLSLARGVLVVCSNQ